VDTDENGPLDLDITGFGSSYDLADQLDENASETAVKG
jgi:hypothetical protein